jgi:hypothetical protein
MCGALFNNAEAVHSYCYKIALFVDKLLGMEYSWNDTDLPKPNFSSENQSECYIFREKPHTDSSGIRPAPPYWPASEYLSERWYFLYRPNGWSFKS